MPFADPGIHLAFTVPLLRRMGCTINRTQAQIGAPTQVEDFPCPAYRPDTINQISPENLSKVGQLTIFVTLACFLADREYLMK